jgi:hypothetical protein
MEQLMVEVLEELTGRELLPDEAAAVMQLAGEAGAAIQLAAVPHGLCSVGATGHVCRTAAPHMHDL